MIQFMIGQKQISVYPCDEPDCPVIYLNTFEGEGEQVLRILKGGGSQGTPLPDFLLCILCIRRIYFQELPVYQALCGIPGLQNIFHRIR